MYRLFENTHLFTTVTATGRSGFSQCYNFSSEKARISSGSEHHLLDHMHRQYLLFLRAVRSLAQQHREYLQKKMEIELMKKQMNDSVQLSNEYASLRKWNHDIENHIMSVMYLMDMKKYEEAETYIASVLSRLNCRPQEKQPEEDCSHEKEH